MNAEIERAESMVLSPRFNVLANRVTLPSLPVPAKQLVPVKLVAPAFQANRERALLEAKRRQVEKRTRQEQERRMSEQRATKQATFTVD